MDRYIVSQLGARMHYAVPRLLSESGNLERFYTDICAAKGFAKLLRSVPQTMLPAVARRLAGRMPSEIDIEKITTFDTLGLLCVLDRMRAKTPSEHTRTALASAEAFSRRVVAHGFGNATAFYGFSAECLEQISSARRLGLKTTVEQIIAPRTILDGLMAHEEERFADWITPERDSFGQDFIDRERAEWSKADTILCGSDFVRNALISCGNDPHKCITVPYGVDSRFALPPRKPHDGPLRVLTIGALGLRKGSPYVVEAAQRMAGHAEFRIIGPSGELVPSALDHVASTVDYLPGVPRAEIVGHYAWADVFLLPSICEGSATVVYEALAAGLPVVCTENTGSVVRDGVDGIIVPIRDTESIIEALEALAADADLRRFMGENASHRAADYDIPAYGRRLREALGLTHQNQHVADMLDNAMQAAR